ncbi:MAG TPA: matrixin family metalloprotease [Gaiellaceae bacterium]|nr:matrixin family metalloprotease [Gaiellaceae bacterium]
MAPFALAAGLAQATNVLREAGHRIVGIPELAGSLAGSRRPKKLRVRVAILRDENGKPVATPEDVEPSLAEAKRVLREAAAIELLAAAEPLVRTIAEPAPAAALDSPCAEGSYRADFGRGGAFFRLHREAGGVTGSGAPLTVFVVRDVLGKAGCSLGPLVDHVTVDMSALTGRRLRVLAHELGHACGLPHSSAAENLMLPTRMGDRLQPWQVAVFRSSRHVTYR